MKSQSRLAQVVPPCHLLRRPRFNVTLTEELSDPTLRRTQDVMEGFVRVSGLPELAVVLESLRRCDVAAAARTLDLVAHADSSGILQFGRSRMAPGDAQLEAFVKAVPKVLADVGFTRLRLIGCYTATGRAAQPALAYLRSKLGDVEVFGCTDFIDESNFDVDGLSSRWDILMVAASSA